MQSCLAEESMRKIPWRNGEEDKMKEILAIFPSRSDNLELHPIKHSQNTPGKSVFLNTEVFRICYMIMYIQHCSYEYVHVHV